jgi:hypothetical protein
VCKQYRRRLEEATGCSRPEMLTTDIRASSDGHLAGQLTAVTVFRMLRLTSGDPATIMAGENASSARIETIRSEWVQAIKARTTRL